MVCFEDAVLFTAARHRTHNWPSPMGAVRANTSTNTLCATPSTYCRYAQPTARRLESKTCLICNCSICPSHLVRSVEHSLTTRPLRSRPPNPTQQTICPQWTRATPRSRKQKRNKKAGWPHHTTPLALFLSVVPPNLVPQTTTFFVRGRGSLPCAVVSVHHVWDMPIGMDTRRRRWRTRVVRSVEWAFLPSPPGRGCVLCWRGQHTVVGWGLPSWPGQGICQLIQ